MAGGQGARHYGITVYSLPAPPVLDADDACAGIDGRRGRDGADFPRRPAGGNKSTRSSNLRHGRWRQCRLCMKRDPFSFIFNPSPRARDQLERSPPAHRISYVFPRPLQRPGRGNSSHTAPADLFTTISKGHHSAPSESPYTAATKSPSRNRPVRFFITPATMLAGMAVRAKFR